MIFFLPWCREFVTDDSTAAHERCLDQLGLQQDKALKMLMILSRILHKDTFLY